MIEQPQPIDALKNMADGFDWLREHVTPVQVQFSFAKDRAISEALQAVQPLWTREEIASRCLIVRCVGSETEQLFVDGTMVLKFEPAEFTQEWFDDKLVITYTQKFRRVVKL